MCMLLTDLVRNPFEGLNEGEQKMESLAKAEGVQAAVEVFTEVIDD
jgi:hypothetical protein